MNRLTRILIGAMCIIFGECTSIAQLTREQVVDALRSGHLGALAEQATAMSHDAKQNSALVILGLMSEKEVIPIESPGQSSQVDMIDLMSILPKLADDATLAASLRRYTESSDELVRRAAFETLSKRHGPAVEQLLAEKIAVSFNKLPALPFHPPNGDAAREVSSHVVLFVLCLKGLSGSDSKQSRDVGAKYLNMFRARYSGSEDGRKWIDAIEQELRRSGISLSDGSAAGSAAVETDQQTSLPVHAPAATLKSSQLLAPAAIERPAPVVERKSLLWPRVVGIAAMAVIGLLVWKRRM